MFFKTDAERAAAQGAKARHDAAAAGTSAASGARNLGAAVLATLAEATAPQDSRKERRHAKKAKAKALKAAGKDRAAASKAASKAAGHGRKAADHGRAAFDKRAEQTGGKVAALSGAAATMAREQAGSAAAAASHAGERLAEQGGRLAEQGGRLVERTGPLGESAKEKAGLGAAVIGALAAAARERAEETRTRAVSGMDHGIDAAVPRAQEGVAAVAPKVDHLRDVINDELLPKLQAMIGEVQTGKDRVLAKDEGVVAALTGAPKAKQRKKGGTMITLGLLAAAGAGLAWYLSQQQRNAATDPWASQGGAADPWASRTPTSTATTTAGTTTATTGGTVSTVADTRPLTGDASNRDDSSDKGAVYPTVADAAEVDVPEGTGVSTTGGAVAGTHEGVAGNGPRMLQTDEIDELAAEEPSTVENQTPGESPQDEIEAARKRQGDAGTL